MIFQFSGLSGAGKSSMATQIGQLLQQRGLSVCILDGDQIRKEISRDLSFSRSDRIENIKRIANLAAACTEDVVIIAAINPYNKGRDYLSSKHGAKLIWIDCSLSELIKRDTKGLYHRAMLPDGHPNKLYNFTGISDPFDIPQRADLIIQTHLESEHESAQKILKFILQNIA